MAGTIGVTTAMPAAEPASDAAPVMACAECGLLQRLPPLTPGTSADCPRCGAELRSRPRNDIDLPLHLYVAALVLFVLANSFTFMVFEMEGRQQANHLFSGVLEFFRQGLWELGTLVLLVSIVIPLTKILASLYVLVPLHYGHRLPAMGRMFRWVRTLHPWAMMEVYLLGVLVAYTKLITLADIHLGVALYAFGGLIIVMTVAEWCLEPHAVWDRLGPPQPTAPDVAGASRAVIACHACDLLARAPAAAHGAPPKCPRCDAALHRRLPDSINRTWALLITAAVLYIPANVYPVMTVISFGRGDPDTILSGIVKLIAAGMWPLAALVFFASVTVPVLKLLGLAFLLVSVQRRWRGRLRERTRLYRIVEAVGRWSMIDIFMISILIALVQLGSIATIEPGVGAISFAAVVVITMIAATCFDPRLMWDFAGMNHDR
jgi:paraquat-inducible protein A